MLRAQEPSTTVAEETELPEAAWQIWTAIRDAVHDDDMHLLRRTMFEQASWPDGTTRAVMRPGVSRTLLLGFPSQSFAELCFEKNRPHMLREVLQAARPASVGDWPTETSVEWLHFLGTWATASEWTRGSLLTHAAVHVKPQSREFITLILELCRDDAAIKTVAAVSSAGAALIAECEMSLAIRRNAALAPANTARTPAPRARHRSL